MIDAVIPDNNEQEFISIAERLGYKTIIFLYKEKTKIPVIDSKKISLKTGILTTKGGKGKPATFLQSTDADQQILENNPSDVMYGFETKSEKDYIHQRASGLNQVLCKLAAKNNVIIIFPFTSLLNTFGVKRAQVLGRIMQNISLCRKYRVKTAIASFAIQPHQMRSPKDLQSLFQLLGMHSSETQKALNTL